MRSPHAPLSNALLAALGLVVLGPAARADLIVDDDGGPDVDFLQIRDAVDAAAPGETIRVRSGGYFTFVVTGKPLVIVAEPGAVVHVRSPSVVRDLAAGEQVRLVGLHFNPAGDSHGVGLVLDQNAGPVWVEDCVVEGGHGGIQLGANGLQGVLAMDCARVVLSRCDVLGGAGFGTGHGAVALLVSASDVALLDGFAQGGAGASVIPYSGGGAGGDGANVQAGGHLTALRSELRGGRGGDTEGDFFKCDPPGSGGDGVLAASGGTLARYDSLFVGGSGGFDFQAGCTGSDGVPIRPVDLPVEERWLAPYCFGTPGLCPCGNEAFDGAGCDNSFGTGGGELTATGEALVSADTLTLHHGEVGPTASAFFFQGDTKVGGGVGAVFGDGLRCAAGAVLRLGSKLSSGGSASYGAGVAGDVPIATKGQVPPGGGVRTYQVWYRNVQAFCTPGLFNLSNALEVLWRP